MRIDDLMHHLKELRKKHGNLEVKLVTQADGWNWLAHDVNYLYRTQMDKIFIVGIPKEKVKLEDEEEDV